MRVVKHNRNVLMSKSWKGSGNGFSADVRHIGRGRRPARASRHGSARPTTTRLKGKTFDSAVLDLWACWRTKPKSVDVTLIWNAPKVVLLSERWPTSRRHDVNTPRRSYSEFGAAARAVAERVLALLHVSRSRMAMFCPQRITVLAFLFACVCWCVCVYCALGFGPR